MSKTIRAAALYRKSMKKDTDQANSFERQSSLVLPYLDRKQYALVDEYRIAIPGDEIENHPEFIRLLRDARSRKFDVLVPDEPSRLSRQDPIRFIARIVDPLR